ncbi:MAG: polynucleotide adenylyltransferase PcnB [Kiritimatiellae bacterium]|nr:polynucleotide adenylyltransferase PcnB [Kiritimatiellia bacterium]
MFGFLGRKIAKKSAPVICERAQHCISRKNIDPDALKVLYRLSSLGYTAYLVGGGVRDLLLGRQPKDFDVGTNATPNEVRKAFRNCFLIGRRFRLAHVRFGDKVIETATFRQNSQTVGEIIEHAAEGPMEDNTFGTPETDAYRRDFTVNGLFYDIKTFSVIDWVGGLKDLKKGIIRSIGDPMIRFREDPVRMMRAIKFAARLDFKIERGTDRAIRKLHSCITTASIPRLCEEVFRLFTYGTSAKAFRMMWKFGLMGDLLPELAEFITSDGGAKSATWNYLAILDRYEVAMKKQGWDVSNGLRAAVLYAAMAKANPGKARDVMGTMSRALKMPKSTYFTAVLMLDSVKRLSQPPQRGRRRFAYNRDFPDALDFNRIVARAEGRDERVLDMWDKVSRKMSKEQGEDHE